MGTPAMVGDLDLVGGGELVFGSHGVTCQGGYPPQARVTVANKPSAAVGLRPSECPTGCLAGRADLPELTEALAEIVQAGRHVIRRSSVTGSDDGHGQVFPGCGKVAREHREQADLVQVEAETVGTEAGSAGGLAV